MGNERNHLEPFEARVDQPYWEALSTGRLAIQRCGGCRSWLWPADWRCYRCGSYEMSWQDVEPEGVVYSWIRTHLPFVPAFAEELPYVNVLVELPHAGGARVLGLLRGDAELLRIGATVVGTVEPPSARTLGQAVMTWRLEDS